MHSLLHIIIFSTILFRCKNQYFDEILMNFPYYSNFRYLGNACTKALSALRWWWKSNLCGVTYADPPRTTAAGVVFSKEGSYHRLHRPGQVKGEKSQIEGENVKFQSPEVPVTRKSVSTLNYFYFHFLKFPF